MRLLAVICCGVLLWPGTITCAAQSTATILSPANGRDLSFQVYTPPGYAENLSRHYPVVISLHGIGGTSQQRASLYAPVLDARINSGEIVPMIWLFPDGQTNSFYGDAFDGHKQVYSHIIHEALPYVDSHFRTIAQREYRAMEGFSMGGYGAGLYAAKHPERFSAIVEYGGALATWQNLVQFGNAVATEMYNAMEANFLPYSLWSVTSANASVIRDEVNYKMIVGDADSQYLGNVRFRDHLISLGIDPQFQVLPGVEHVGGAYLNEGSGLQFLSQHFAASFQRSGDFDRDGDVDASDYDSWRISFGSTTELDSDGNRDGVVDAADYVVWRRSLAASDQLDAPESDLIPAVSAIIPEPSTRLALAICGALVTVWRKTRPQPLNN
jgi:enterochelin esterase-like enzyme